ncbi:MAG: M14 family zinc carboxypeptidase, partial [Pseudomonadota bacterium]
QHGFRGIDWRERYAVFELNQRGVDRLVNAGWSVVPDRLRQAELDRWMNQFSGAVVRGDSGTIPGFSCYRTVEQTELDLNALVQQFPSLIDVRVVGETWREQQGNPNGDVIEAYVIGNQHSPYPRAPLVIMAAQHARELATAEIATRFAEYLMQQQAVDPDIRWLLDHRDIHIVAQLNPDGRREVESGTAFWRKNANVTACPNGNQSSTWPGIDLNRNSSFLWGNSSSSGNPCSEIYRGSVPSSEPETQAIQAYLDSVFQRQRPATDLTTPAPDDAEGIFISIHSFSELVLLPWDGLGSGNQNNAPNHDQLTILGRKFGFFTDYAVGRWQLLGPAGGTTTDFAYGEFGVASYTFEVGTSFQQDCTSFENTIWPVNREALVYAARAARRPFQTPFGPEITALAADLVDNQVNVTGLAVDDRYFRGSVTEPPSHDPIANVVEIIISLGVPPYLAADTFSVPIQSPATSVDFNDRLPVDTMLPGNGLLFAVAVDADGAVGVPSAVQLGTTVFVDGFESD